MLFDPQRVLIVAEVAQAHDGSLGSAHSLVDAAAYCGVDAVKFQTHIAAEESTPSEPWRVKFSDQDQSRYQYWQRMQFSEEQWIGLRNHARGKGMLFSSSPFSLAAVELLSRVGVEFWKVASGEVLDAPVLQAIGARREPVMISTGLCTLEEVRGALKQLRYPEREVAVLHCTTAYPTAPEEVGLNVMNEIRGELNCAVGLSDHSGTIFPGLMAAGFGASVLEVHTTHSRFSFGPDVPASLTIEELKQLVEGIRFVERMLKRPGVLRRTEEKISALRKVFGKGLLAKMDLPPGTEIRPEFLVGKKPMAGIPSTFLGEISGRRLLRPVKEGAFLTWEDIEQ